MAMSVKNLDPLNIGVPTYAPKLWMMLRSRPGDDRVRSDLEQQSWMRNELDLIGQLEPLERSWPVV